MVQYKHSTYYDILDNKLADTIPATHIGIQEKIAYFNCRLFTRQHLNPWHSWLMRYL